MGRARSASKGRCYGQARVLRAWHLPRSTFYHPHRRQASPRLPARRGPKTHYTDDELLGEIRRTIQASPFHGGGHRKVWPRLRLAGVRISSRRVLRLRRQHQETILAERPNQIWGIDALAGFTLLNGQVPVFAMIDHCSACCLAGLY